MHVHTNARGSCEELAVMICCLYFVLLYCQLTNNIIDCIDVTISTHVASYPGWGTRLTHVNDCIQHLHVQGVVIEIVHSP